MRKTGKLLIVCKRMRRNFVMIPKVFESMNNYTVKGGYALPEKFE